MQKVNKINNAIVGNNPYTENMNKIKERKKVGAVCPKCKSPDYKYNGRANSELGEYWQENGKHQFECNSCGHHWQYGKTESIYTQLM